MRLQTDKQASYHLSLAQQIKNDLEGPTAAFAAQQTRHKKNFQAPIEKEFRSKQLQEGYVNKAREKYETDCRRINTYTAESTLVQGKELEKIQLKLERAQQTVQANERDFSNFAKALQDTVQKWEQNWKEFCDTCQDLEEERLEFTKECMWASTNAVAAVCVQDDEVCIICNLPAKRYLKGACNSRARKHVSLSNNWSPKRTWRTLSAIMELETLYLTHRRLSTMQMLTQLLRPQVVPPHI